MAKLFKTSEDIYEFITNEWENTSALHIGVILKVISTPKAKQIFKLSKASATTEYLLREQDVITLTVYEEAFDRLSDLYKTLLVKGVFSVVSYDDEKERILIDNRPYADLFNMRHAKDANGNDMVITMTMLLKQHHLLFPRLRTKSVNVRNKKRLKRLRNVQQRRLQKIANHVEYNRSYG